MFIETRVVGKRKKFYLVHSYREDNKVKRLAKYLGTDLNNLELNEAKQQAEQELREKLSNELQDYFKYINDKDPWMLGEDIPDMDFFFSKIWLTCFVNEFEREIGRTYKKIMVIYKGMRLWFYYGEKDGFEVGENILNKFLKQPGFMKEVNQNIIKEADILKNFAKKIQIDRLHKKTSKELWEIYEEHERVHAQYYTWCWIPVAVDMFHGNLTNRLMNFLEQKGAKEKCSEYFAILTQPQRESLIQVQERELLEIARKINKDKEQRDLFKELFKSFEEEYASKRKLAPHTPEYEAMLRRHIQEIEDQIDPQIKKEMYEYYEKYFYVKFMFIGRDGTYTYQHFLKKLVKLIGREANVDKQLKDMDQQLIETKKRAEEVKKRLKIDKKWTTIFENFGEFMVTKIYRRYAQIYALYKMHEVLEEIAKRVGLKKEEVQFMLPEEVMQALLHKGRVNKREIKKRTEFCVYYAEKGKKQVFTGQKAKKLAKRTQRKKIKGVSELKGQTGCIGYGKGEVKIINKPSEIHKMKQGDILVSIATDPDIVPAMKKAAAIVTEQGGVTSHAAIVARELNIPCVIGTKIVTSVFKDGDFVEVDATNGIVKKITKEQAQQKNTKKDIKVKTSPKKEEKMTANKESNSNILWFKDIQKEDILSVGGKGASLGEMHSTMPIPNGFCITTKAYKEVLNKHHDEFLKILENRDIESNEELQSVANIIKQKIINIDLPQELKEEIATAYNELKGKVAVRSSATTEDLDDASFAGQQDTYLNIEGIEDMYAAVKKCWASLFNARAIYYREKNNFKHDEAFLSVVIQQMVDADKAGVLFTMNPINKSKEEMIVEACFGLGEKLVSGEITPDTFILNRDGSVKEQYLNFEKQTLSSEELQELAKIGKKIAAHYKKPMDIEWAIHNNKIHVLQARPITTK